MNIEDKPLYGFSEAMKKGQGGPYMSSIYLQIKSSVSCRTEIILWFLLWSWCSLDQSDFIPQCLRFLQLSSVSSMSYGPVVTFPSQNSESI